MSHSFFAFLGRLRLIQRWSLMRNTSVENVMEHSFQVAYLAHALAWIRRLKFPQAKPQLDPDRVLAQALYHDATEILTGDLPTPIKYGTEALRQAYQSVEKEAASRLLGTLPEFMQASYAPYLERGQHNEAVQQVMAGLVKAADHLSAYIKCQEEVGRGNQEFAKAKRQIEQKLLKEQEAYPELAYFLELFSESFERSLDEL